MARLSAKGRKMVSQSNFALPQERRYPIHDLTHARQALRMVAAHGSDAEKKKVRAAVFRKYPQLRKNNE